MEEIVMRIPDFKKLLQETKRGGQFEPSKAFFIVQRKIISEIYGDFPDVDTFKIYLYLCKHFNRSRGWVPKGKARISSDLKYVSRTATGSQRYSTQVNASLSWLEIERFIDRVSGNISNRYRASILVAPDYHYQKQKFSPCDEIQFELFDLKNHQQGYIMIPKKSLENSDLSNTTYAKRSWTERSLKTLLMLYAYCWPEVFGGIDPNVVRIDQQGDLSLSERFCFALKGSPAEIKISVISLIKRGYFKPVECVFEDGTYEGDEGTFVPSSQASTVIVLRPTHLIESVLTTPIMKRKQGSMRI